MCVPAKGARMGHSTDVLVIVVPVPNTSNTESGRAQFLHPGDVVFPMNIP